MPERFQVEGRTHYASYLQKTEKYKRTAQKDYVMPATRGREKVHRCCNRVMLTAAAMKRHCVLIHRDRKPVSKRKRPTRVAFKRRVVRRKAATSPRGEATGADEPSDDKSSEEEEEEELEDDELEEELQTVEVVAMVNKEDSESAEDSDDAQDVKYEHCGIIGTIALTGGEQEPSEFFIRYPKSSCEDAGEDWTSINSECLLLPTDDFKSSLLDPPAFDRGSLGWGAEIEGKDLLFRYGKPGYDFWYQATIGTYDGSNKHHEILPTDGTPKLDVDLLKCKRTIIKEWRFVQPDERIETSLNELND